MAGPIGPTLHHQVTIMQHRRLTSASRTRGRQPRAGVADPFTFSRRQVRRSRALRAATTVRRAIQAARTGGNGVVGSPSTIDALSRNLVSELLVTRRFAELEAAANVIQLAAAHGVRSTTISGPAELELDLIGNGVAALLRRPSLESVVGSHPA
jgi:hypothetical protein